MNSIKIIKDEVELSTHFKDGLIDSRPFSHDYDDDDDCRDDHDDDDEISFVSRLFKDGSIDSRSTSLSLLSSGLARGQCCHSTRLRGLVMMVMLIMVVLIMINKL